VRIYCSGPDGLCADRHLLLDRILTGDAAVGAAPDLASIGAGADNAGMNGDEIEGLGRFVYKVSDSPRITIVSLQGQPRLFLCPGDEALLLTFTSDRRVADVVRIPGGPYVSAAAGPVATPGAEDLVLVSRRIGEDGAQRSWVYWDRGGVGELADRYSADSRTSFRTVSANDAIVVDLDGSGRAAVVVCQDMTESDYSTTSQILRFGSRDKPPESIVLPTLCALDVAAVRRPSGPTGIVFGNHRSETALGHIDSPIYLGGPDGYREERRIDLRGWGACEMKFIDFWDRGRPDVLMVNSNENARGVRHPSFIFHGDEGGPRVDAPVELASDRALSAVVADFDRDGYLDVVMAGWGTDPALCIFRGGSEGFGTPEPISTNVGGQQLVQPRFMASGDLRRAGWLDLVVPMSSGAGGTAIYWGGPDGFSAERATLLPTEPVIFANLADLDGDGWLDLLLGQYKGPDPFDYYRGAVLIYWGGPDGFSNHRRMELPASFPTDVAVADFNNDGNLDLFVSNYYGWRTRDIDSYLYWGGSAGSFDPERVTRLPHHSAHGGLAADFNEDGYIDLAVANHREAGNHPSRSYIWWNGPEGLTPDRRTELPTRGPHGISHTDLGNIVDRGPEEYFESRPLPIPETADVTSVTWQGTVPAKCWVKAQCRRAPSAEQLGSARWVGPGGADTWYEDGRTPTQATIRSEEHRVRGGWLQYRLALGAINAVATPRIHAVEIHYRDTVD
jgi:hypothetical protein